MMCDEQMLAVKSEVAKCLGRNQSSSMESVVAEVCMNLYKKRLYIQFSDETVISSSLRRGQLLMETDVTCAIVPLYRHWPVISYEIT